MASEKKYRPGIPKAVQNLLWLRAGGRCEFRGCNKILYVDSVTQNPINESNIAHIVSWIETGPRGDKILSPKLATDIDNLMLTCPEHNKLIDTKENVEKYTTSVLQEMKQEHEKLINKFTGLITNPPKCVIELKGTINNQKTTITQKEVTDALFPFYPDADPIIIDVSDFSDIEVAKAVILSKVKNSILWSDNDKLYAAFIMASIPLGCYLGYLIGDKVSVQSFQHFRDTDDWKWRDVKGSDFTLRCSDVTEHFNDVKLFVNVSGVIDARLTPENYPIYTIEVDNPSLNSLQSWNQILMFRSRFREMLDTIRNQHGENVKVHLFLATPSPINFEIGRNIMKKLDPTIILYDKTDEEITYREVMYLHNRTREK